MPLRFQKSKKETTRKQGKLRYIQARNHIKKWPECWHGDFYCNHVYDPAYPWAWVDFRFFHSTKKMYYAVAMTTCEYDAIGEVEGRAWDEAEEVYPFEYDLLKSRDFFAKIKAGRTETEEKRHALMQELVAKYGEEPSKQKPSITIKDYGTGCRGIFVSVNKDYIDEHVIREFIQRFRTELGEPTKPGWTHKDEEVTVIPNEIYRRYPYVAPESGADSGASDSA